MKCEACQSVIEDFFDGELGSKQADAVAMHLADCSACAASLAELRREHDIYARYEREIEVTPDLWSSIESRIRLEKAAIQAVPRWRQWLSGLVAVPHISPAFAVALVVLAIAGTVAVMSYLHSRDTRSQQPAIAEVHGGDDKQNPPIDPAKPGNSNQNPVVKPERRPNDSQSVGKRPAIASVPKQQAPPDPMQLVREAEQKYVKAIAILSRDVNRQRSQIDPGVLARFDAALLEIDQTIAETREIVRRNPGDPVALQYLLGAYAKKVDTLRAMTLD